MSFDRQNAGVLLRFGRSDWPANCPTAPTEPEQAERSSRPKQQHWVLLGAWFQPPCPSTRRHSASFSCRASR
ncbi:hypothetical protein T484DRAFT_1960695 [Baffinella frigidus]|nr:hypothetical protein T484DRAFT_1960695 [Cryptophyta sp. CCMP2293]